jgi:hypothetical protein
MTAARRKRGPKGPRIDDHMALRAMALCVAKGVNPHRAALEVTRRRGATTGQSEAATVYRLERKFRAARTELMQEIARRSSPRSSRNPLWQTRALSQPHEAMMLAERERHTRALLPHETAMLAERERHTRALLPHEAEFMTNDYEIMTRISDLKPNI